MARKPTTKTPGTDIVDWEAEMKKQAEIAAGAQRASGGGGKFFSTRAGVLQLDGNALPGNQMAVIVLADIMENSWYDGPFDPDAPAAPKCFAFGHHEDAMEPHTKVDADDYFERQHDVCAGCPRNEWGSAPTGKGKDCKNVMRLSMIPAGVYKSKGTGRNQTFELELIEDEDHFAKAEAAYLKLPVMSVKHYSKFVKQIAQELGRPPHGVITNVYIEPDPKSQYAVKFEVIGEVDKEFLPAIMNRHNAERASLDFPYSPPQDDDERAAAPARSNNKLRGGAGSKARGKK